MYDKYLHEYIFPSEIYFSDYLNGALSREELEKARARVKTQEAFYKSLDSSWFTALNTFLLLQLTNKQ